MFLPSTLRRAHNHVRHYCNCNYRRNSTKSRFAIPNISSRLINSHNTSKASFRAWGAGTSFSLRHTWKRPVSLLQNAYYFSTEVAEANSIKPRLLINATGDLPEIYASPAALLEAITNNRNSESVAKSIFINHNGNDEQWFTATYIDTDSKKVEYFYSGKFGGELMNKLNPSFSWGETCLVDGKVYYRSEHVAKEAAAARALDCHAFRLKYSKLGMNLAKEGNPIRYCVEIPYLFPMFGEGIPSIVTEKHWHAPAHYWSCLMQAKYGPIDVNFDVQLMPFKKSDATTGGSETEEAWYSATCVEPKTGETFESSVFGPDSLGFSYMPDAPTTPLPLEECRTDGERVYYSNELTAKHAAAARAIDCMNFRAGKESIRLCLEEPYLTSHDKQQMQPTNYERLKAVVEGRCRGKSGFSFSDFIKSQQQDFGDSLNPRAALIQGIISKYDRLSNKTGGVIGSLGMLFNLEWLGDNDGDWFTSTFIDPVTKEQFSSGIVRVPEYTMHHSAIIRVYDGKVYYKSGSNNQSSLNHRSGKSHALALAAAAARAIDCYAMRDKKDDESEQPIQLCYEEPYGTIEEGLSQSIDYDSILAQRDDHLSKRMNSRILSVNETDKSEQSEPTARDKKSKFSSVLISTPHLLHVPKNFLHTAFSAKHGEQIRQSFPGCFDVQEEIQEGKQWFTATFTDPITNEIFSSGLGAELDVEKHPTASLKPPLHLAESKILDGKVYYGQAKLAEHAAAARAIDCYIFREENQTPIGINSEKFKLCVEDPYEGESERNDVQQIDYERDKFVSNEQNEVFQMKPKEDDLPALTFSFANETTKVSNKLSTMGRIAEIWTDTAALDSSTEASSQWHINPAIDYEVITQSPSAKIEGILDWYEKVNSEPQNAEAANALVQLCNKILTALGKANKELDLDKKESYINVEHNAQKILDKVISLSKAFDNKQDPSFLNADTFNAYIHCLSRLQPARSANAAEYVLKRMMNKEKIDGIVHPLPNVGTYNACMDSWALVDGIDGQSGVNDVYSLLEVASLGGVNECSLRPNKNTFKTLLAVNSKLDSSFSYEKAKLWLEKIQHISETICSEVFIPDADIYNAALAPLSKKPSTANRYANSWLSYGHQYDGGFKSVNEQSNTEAMDIAKWLLYAEECGVDPNTEMYEAVIQAWTETGTKDGLLIAEDWAKRAVSSNAPTRLDTFHPIIAAWALCQFERSPARVQEWNKQLTALSESKPHLKPDYNTLSAQIIAWRNVQAGIIDNFDATKQSSSEEKSNSSSLEINTAFVAAQNCTQVLKEMFSDGGKLLDSSQDTMAFISMFTHTIETWGCASRFALLHPPSSVSLDTSHGVHEMLKIARLFDAKIDESESKEHAQHRLHLMGESYAAIISQLHQIDSAVDLDASATTCYFSQKFAHVERMLRDFEFFSRIHFSQKSFTPEAKAVRHQLYREILQGCAGVKSSADYGHVMRLCRLIMDHLSWRNERCQDIGSGRVEEDISDIYVDMARIAGVCVKVPHERMYVLTTIFNNASDFFERRRRKHENSRYATVDKARLIGAMRMAMGDSDLTEKFLRNFDDRPPKRKARGNTALSFVEDLLKAKGNR